ncbi:hypothetical protein Vspart_02500 [Vibrio spartinae]|uniref:Uncharacterized protein n=1 Tax=Vibrio spartinae TaxID=1918945 RepID=A0A1N6M134_9VIBR|nr:hypothetical protein Vspart_02500 [Vibrio spartinae]SIO93076.1 hypothetical protein VSP9026_00724 [Vibrio spartinae]
MLLDGIAQVSHCASLKLVRMNRISGAGLDDANNI